MAESAPEVLWRLRPILAVAEHPELVQPWRQDLVHVPVQLSKEALAQLHARSIQTFSMRSTQSGIECSSAIPVQYLMESNIFVLPPMLSPPASILSPSLEYYRGRQLSLSCLLSMSSQRWLSQLQLDSCDAVRPCLLVQKGMRSFISCLRPVCCLNDRHDAPAQQEG